MSDLRAPVHPSAISVPLRGEIDCLTAGAIDDAARRALRQGAPGLVLDLRDVTYMDSQGLNAMLAANRSLQARGTALTLRGIPRCVRRLLELTGTDSVFAEG